MMAMFRTPACSSSTARPRPAGSPCCTPTSSSPSSARSGASASARAPIRLLDEAGREVPDGEPGELYSCNPYTFDGYWNLPEKTAGGLPRRLLHGRRHGAARRRRLHPSGRPQEQHDHLRRREHLPVRGRGHARRPPRGPGRGGDRRCPTRNGASASTPSSSCATATRRPRPSCSNGARTASPATSGRARCHVHRATTRCRAPRPARSCIAS